MTTSQAAPEHLDRSVTMLGARVHYLTAGDLPRHLLLLHGSGADSARLSYEQLLPRLARDFTVVAPDFPGYGESDRTPNADTTEALVEFVVALLDALRLDTVDVAGLSMGGGVALGLAVRHPHRVRRVVLMGAHGLVRRSLAGLTALAVTRLPAPMYGWTWRYAASDPRRTRRTMRRVWADHRRLTDELLENIRRELGRPDAWRVVRAWSRSEAQWTGYRTCYLDQLPQIRTPVLLVHGAKDRLVPISGARDGANRFPDAQLVLLPECGHWIPRECPDELVNAIKEFLLVQPEGAA